MERLGTKRRWARTGVVGRLNAEWSVLADEPATAQACLRWSLDVPALSGATTVEGVLHRIGNAPDAVLGGLLAAAAGGDTLAGRVVLQAMLGKLLRMAAGDPWAPVDDYVAMLWCTIARYPLAARPERIAANLALDTLKAVRGERGDDRDVPWEPAAVNRVVQDRGARPCDREAGPWGSGVEGGGLERLTATGVIGSAQRHRLLDPGTGALLHSVYAEGLSGSAAAQRHHTSPGALRVRCSRAVRVLSQHAVLLLDVA